MAVKDVLQYYNECETQYKEFMEEMNDFRDLCSQGMVAPEIIENSQKMFSLIEDNYKKLSYVIFLLNKPTKKKKYKTYRGQNKKLLDKSITKEEVLKSNQNSIEGIKDLKETLK